MPRTTLTLIAIFWQLLAFGQLKIITTTYNGKTYKVYPVRIPLPESDFDYLSDWAYTMEDVSSMGDIHDIIDFKKVRKRGKKKKVVGLWPNKIIESSLPFNPFKLDDGQYLLYYEKRPGKWDKQLQMDVQSHEDTTLVAAIFSIVNNKKSGTATWYDYTKKARLLQSGFYKNGIKEGEWTIYRKDEKRVYHYVDGLKNGLEMNYKKGAITSECKWERDLLDGEYINYINYKSGKISQKDMFNNGGLVESKKFDKKGNLTYWHNTNNTDNILTRYYTEGRLTKTVSEPDTSNVSKVQSWSKKGVLIYTAYKPKYWYYSSILENSWFNQSSYALFRRMTDYQELAVEQYYENGQLRIKYDLRTDNLSIPIKEYSKSGQVLQEFYMDAQDSSLIHINKYNEKKGYLENKQISYYSSEWLSNLILSEDQDTVVFRAAPYLLSLKNPNVGGFKKCYYYQGKKSETTSYNLLHTRHEVSTTIYKGNPTVTAKFKVVNDSTIEVVHSEFDVKHVFEVEHKYRMYMPTNDSSGFPLVYYADTKQIEHKGILDLYDTLDYRIKLFGEPYSGYISVERKWDYSPKRYKLKLDIEKEKIDREVLYDTSINLKSFVDCGGGYWTKSIKLSHGQPTKINHGYSDNATYVDSKKQGECTDIGGAVGNYQDGLRHGVYRSDAFMTEHYKGLKHGLDLKFGYYSQFKEYTHQLEYKATFIMDTLHGLFQSFAEPEVVSQSVVFEKGYPNGTYFQGNVTSPTSVLAQLDHGYLIDTAYYYFKEGGIKVKVNYNIADSVSYLDWYGPPTCITGGLGNSSFYADYYRSEKFLSRDKLINLQPSRTGDYQYFYKNGVVASEGRIEQRQRVDTWKHWDLNGQLFKVITYDSGWYVNPVTQDSLFYFGKVQMWYPNGKELLTGLIRSNNMRFKCDQEMRVNMETLYYLSFYDEAGNQTITNGSGEVVEFHNNGETRLTGQLKNGRRFGLWKFYDPNGRLQEIGRYDEYGLRHGLWVAGDLEAVPYFENLCMDGEVSAYNFPDVDQVGYVTQEIGITEVHYEHGRSKNMKSTRMLPLF